MITRATLILLFFTQITEADSPPLTVKERTESAKETCLKVVQAMNENMKETRFKAKVFSVIDKGPKGGNFISVVIRGGDKRNTQISCECRVRDNVMKIERIAFNQNSSTNGDSTRRKESVESIDDILRGWLTTHDSAQFDVVIAEWEKNKEAVRKIDRLWTLKTGGHEYRGGSKSSIISFSVALHPDLHFNYPIRGQNP